MNLKEKMKKGPVYGVAIFTGAACAVEAVGNLGYDFVFLDLEHTPLDAGAGMEKLIMAALRTGVSPLVRTADDDEVVLRKLVEMGAEGVIVPHTRTAADVERIVRAVKFPPLGRRGADSNVRAAGFGGPGFSWEAYIAGQNAGTMVIPMDEDFEFTENIEAIMASPCVDAVNFGPLDYALSVGVPIRYKMDDPKVARVQTPRGARGAARHRRDGALRASDSRIRARAHRHGGEHAHHGQRHVPFPEIHREGDGGDGPGGEGQLSVRGR